MTSHTDGAVMAKAIERHDFDCVQMAMNPVQGGRFEELALPAANRKNLGVILMKVTAQDKLFVDGGADAVSLLRYAWSLPILGRGLRHAELESSGRTWPRRRRTRRRCRPPRWRVSGSSWRGASSPWSSSSHTTATRAGSPDATVARPPAGAEPAPGTDVRLRITHDETSVNGAPLMNSPRFRLAFDYAATLHAADVRKGSGIPYISHLLDVCAIVMRYGGNEDAVIAALLHDAAEDHGGKPRLADIQRNFGKAVAAVVRECTDSTETRKEPWEVRKRSYLRHLPKAPAAGCSSSAADKLSNVRAILSDHYVIGDDVFKRFKRPKRRTLWYYNALCEVFSAHLRGDLPKELRRTVDELNRVSKYKPAR